MGFFKNIAQRLFRSELWTKAGGTYFGATGYIGSNPQADLTVLVQDICASCTSARSDVRSYADVEFTGRDRKLVADLFYNSPDFALYSDFLTLMSQDEDSYGNSFWYVDEKKLRRMNPNYVQIVVSGGVIVGYIPNLVGTQINPKRVMHWKRYSSIGTNQMGYVGETILGRSIPEEIDYFLQTKHLMGIAYARYVATDGVPAATLTFDQTLTNEQILGMKTAWQEKTNPLRRDSNVGIVHSGGKIIYPNTLNDLAYIKGFDLVADVIRQAYRTPKIVLGDTDNVNFSNGTVSFAVFIKVVVDQWHFRLSQFLNIFFANLGYDVQISINGKITTDELRVITGNSRVGDVQDAKNE